MKKFFVLMGCLFLVFLILGCTTKQPINPDLSKNISFIQEYSNIKATEEQYDLYSKTEMSLFIDYLSDIKEQYIEMNTTDARAIAAFVEFRMNLLKAQENIILAEEKIEYVVCNDSNTFEAIFNELNSAESNTYLALNALNLFKENFPDYVGETSISEETEVFLNALLEETKSAISELNTEYALVCE